MLYKLKKPQLHDTRGLCAIEGRERVSKDRRTETLFL